jgi:regulator of replication initiation timing
MPKTMQGVDLDGIGRLEDKVKRLIDMVGQLRTEHARVKEENLRLARELDAARQRLADAEGTAAEFATLKEEREVIRGRVADMLQQLEALSL